MQLENQSAGTFRSWLWLCYYFLDLFVMDTGLALWSSGLSWLPPAFGTKHTLLPSVLFQLPPAYGISHALLPSILSPKAASELHFQPDILPHSFLTMCLHCPEIPSHSAHIHASFSPLRAKKMSRLCNAHSYHHVRGVVLAIQARRVLSYLWVPNGSLLTLTLIL